jgi:hypothetical protein
MGQNKRSRHKPTHLHPADLPQRSPKHMMQKRQPLQPMLLEKLYIHVQRIKLDP